MELARKMLDKAYVHKFSANGFDQKLLEAIGVVKDSVNFDLQLVYPA
jgi:hypothetical protein